MERSELGRPVCRSGARDVYFTRVFALLPSPLVGSFSHREPALSLCRRCIWCKFSLRLFQPHGGQRHCASRNLPWSRRRFGDQSPKGGVVCAGEWELSEVEQSEVCRDDYSISRTDGGWCWNEKSLPTSMYFRSLSGLGASPTFLLTNTEQSPPFNNQHCL